MYINGLGKITLKRSAILVSVSAKNPEEQSGMIAIA